MDDRIWYAIMVDNDDNDWRTGSFDKKEAVARCLELRKCGHPEAYIAIIDDGSDAICIGEIHDISEYDCQKPEGKKASPKRGAIR